MTTKMFADFQNGFWEFHHDKLNPDASYGYIKEVSGKFILMEVLESGDEFLISTHETFSEAVEAMDRLS